MDKDFLQSTIRGLLSMLAGSLITQGYLTKDAPYTQWIEAITGILVFVAVKLWSKKHIDKIKESTNENQNG